MQILIYRPGDCPRKLLAAAIEADPGQAYLVMPECLVQKPLDRKELSNARNWH